MNNEKWKNQEYSRMVNEIFKEEEENVKNYGNLSKDLSLKIQYIFKDKIHSKCLNQMNEFSKYCEIINGSPKDSIKPISGKEKECKQALSYFEQCQKSIQEVYEYYSNVLEFSESFSEKQKEICLEECYTAFVRNKDKTETRNCLKDCNKVVNYGNKANCFFLQEYKKQIMNDLKNL